MLYVICIYNNKTREIEWNSNGIESSLCIQKSLIFLFVPFAPFTELNVYSGDGLCFDRLRARLQWSGWADLCKMSSKNIQMMWISLYAYKISDFLSTCRMRPCCVQFFSLTFYPPVASVILFFSLQLYLLYFNNFCCLKFLYKKKFFPFFSCCFYAIVVTY